MARQNVLAQRPKHPAHPDNAIGRNKQPSAGGQRTSGGNPAIDRDPYSPSSVDSRINNLENRREVGAPYSNHSKMYTTDKGKYPTEHEPNSSRLGIQTGASAVHRDGRRPCFGSVRPMAARTDLGRRGGGRTWPGQGRWQPAL